MTTTFNKWGRKMKESKDVQPRNKPNQDLYLGCLIGGAVGDALGAPVEFMSSAEIASQFGPGGIQDYVPVFGKIGSITDDTQMTLFTAEGVVRSWVRAFVHAPCAIPTSIALAYQRWLHTQGLEHPLHNHCLNGWLITQKNLFARRAPGATCMSGLQSMQTQGDVAKNDSKGCGGVMRVAPIGMYFATLAEKGDANKSDLLNEAFATGCRSAAITHGHPTGQLASGAFAALVMLLLTNTSLDLAIETVLPLLAAQTDHEETTQAIQHAFRLAGERPNDVSAMAQLGGGWIAEEALAIALYCALSAESFRSGVVLAVNHGGDSDSTGSMTGQLLGAMHGAKAIPDSWRMPLELASVIEAMAYDLATFSGWGSVSVDESNDQSARYQDDSFDESTAANDGAEKPFDPLEGIVIPVLTDEDKERFAAAELAITAWEEDFRATAEVDDLLIFRKHLSNLELPDEPELLLDGTVHFVQLMAGYSTPKNQFLENQKYDSVKAIGAAYQVTFCSLGNAYARLNLPASLLPVDLADLYDDGIGYNEFLISRADRAALSPEELAAFEKVIWNDFLHDYGEGELEIFFEHDDHAGILKVSVQSVDEDSDEDFNDDDDEIEDDDTKQGPVQGGKPHE